MKRKSLFALSAVVVVAAAALVPVLWSGGDNLHNGAAMAATPADQAAMIKRGEYLARAYFPNEPRRDRNVLIDETSFDLDPDEKLTLVGILRHELGHTLGWRHEHTRPESGK